jgi:hypothetical protein
MKRPSYKKQLEWEEMNPAPEIRHISATCKDHNRRAGSSPWGCDCPGSLDFYFWCRRHWRFLGISA